MMSVSLCTYQSDTKGGGVECEMSYLWTIIYHSMFELINNGDL